MSDTISWGILGTAGIALNKVIPGMLKGTRGTVRAIASRDAARAAEAAQRFGLASSYGSYEALLADPAIDAIYIPLPNQLHVPWSVRAMEAGKHVLCEKPIALDADEAAALVSARERTGKQVLEAFMVRQHPQWLRVRDLVRSGRIGEVRLVQTTLSFFNMDAANVRNRVETGGGALYDIGCYAVLLSRFVLGAEPVRAVAVVERDPSFEAHSWVVESDHPCVKVLAWRLHGYLGERNMRRGFAPDLPYRWLLQELRRGVVPMLGVTWDDEGELVADEGEPEPGFLAAWKRRSARH